MDTIHLGDRRDLGGAWGVTLVHKVKIDLATNLTLNSNGDAVNCVSIADNYTYFHFE